MNEMLNTRRLVCVILIVAIGCDSSNSNPSGPTPTAKASPLGVSSNDNPLSSKKSESTERLIGDIQFKIPPTWEEKALASTVLLAEYSLPGQFGSARLTFSTAGGGMDANMARWKDQFRRGTDDPEPKQSSINAAGKEATLIELQGTFNDTFGGGGPRANWQLLGAAIPISADHNYFVKLTGPAQTITTHREEFLTLLQNSTFNAR